VGSKFSLYYKYDIFSLYKLWKSSQLMVKKFLECSENHSENARYYIFWKHTYIHTHTHKHTQHTHTHIYIYIYIYIYTEWRKKNACFLNGYVCLRFLSLGLPQIKSLHSKTSYSRRSESFHSRSNCNCATRNVSKCDAELWGQAPDVCTARRTPYFQYSFP